MSSKVEMTREEVVEATADQLAKMRAKGKIFNAVGDQVAALHTLRKAITAGLNQIGTDPRPKEAIACQECYQRGWLAAMRSLQGL